jgi:two-component system, OmpR family, sensor kinase
LKQYEKHTYLKFIGLYFLGFVIFYLVVGGLYFFSSSKQLEKEQQFEARITWVECQNITKILGEVAPPCTLETQEVSYHIIYIELVSLFILLGSLFLVLSHFLALYSLRPIREATIMIDDFIGHIVHDISTPLSSILLNAKGLQKSANSDQSKKLTRIISSSNNIVALKEDLLTLVKEEKVELNSETLDLAAVIKEEVVLFEVGDEIRCDMECFEINIDRLELIRVLHNLISNAIKYNQNHHVIDISLRRGKLQISDKGIGIKNSSRVFDNFYREAKGIQGTGLGLSVVKKICDHWNIAISLESEIAKGTTFTLDFSKLHINYTKRV